MKLQVGWHNEKYFKIEECYPGFRIQDPDWLFSYEEWAWQGGE